MITLKHGWDLTQTQVC